MKRATAEDAKLRRLETTYPEPSAPKRDASVAAVGCSFQQYSSSPRPGTEVHQLSDILGSSIAVQSKTKHAGVQKK
eukprot:1378684-Pleurochrysis_carterae.AAC.1